MNSYVCNKYHRLHNLYVGMKLYAFVVIALCSSVFMYTFAAIQFDIYLQYIKYLYIY